MSMRIRSLLVALVALAGLGAASAPEDLSRKVTHVASVPETMLAAAADHAGGPEVLTAHRLPVLKPNPGEVLIAVHAAGVAAWDADMRRNPGPRMRFPLVLGTDGAGVVAGVGADVRNFKVGDEVYAVGGVRGGFYAEYVVVPAERVARIPKGMRFEEAAALAASGLSALQGLDDVLQMQRGEALIVHGAAGGVGTLAIQLAKLRGVRVLATATSEDGLALVRRLGADMAVNGRTDDIAGAARQLYSGLRAATRSSVASMRFAAAAAGESRTCMAWSRYRNRASGYA